MTVRIRDDGSGSSERELSVTDSGRETPLSRASGPWPSNRIVEAAGEALPRTGDDRAATVRSPLASGRSDS